MEFGAPSRWVGQGMTIKDILEKVDLFNISVEDDTHQQDKQKNLQKNSEGKTVIQASDPTSAYLGPRLWEKQISLSLDFSNGADEEDEEINDVMNMEEFLAENNIILPTFNSNSRNSTEDMELDNNASPTYSSSSPPTFAPSSPTYSFTMDRKPVERPNVIVQAKREKVDTKNSLPKGENLFLYAESKRAKLEREKEERRQKLEVDIDFSPEDLALATVPGLDFNPKERSFQMEELRPQPIIKKRKKTFVADDAKDDKYWQNRLKNNVAARRSREARRLKENQIALRAAYLERENKLLQKELDDVHFYNSKLSTEREILKKKLSKYEGISRN